MSTVRNYTGHPSYQPTAPNRWAWYSVETPSVFQEIKLPAAEEDFTAAQSRQYKRLEALAEQHGTNVRYSQYRRG